MVKEIEGVVRHLCDGGKLSESPSAAEESTLRRWWKEYRVKLQEWTGLLEDTANKLFHQAPNIIKLLSHPVKRLEAALSRLPFLPSRWTVMVKTLWWLNPSHPLYLS